MHIPRDARALVKGLSLSHLHQIQHHLRLTNVGGAVKTAEYSLNYFS
jgi:hypothetical protein